jgi:uncharacterized membrane protein YqiK
MVEMLFLAARAAKKTVSTEGGGLTLPVIIIIAVVAFIILLLIAFKTFYKKAQADLALVRTGKGGEKVAIDKGMFCWGLLHQWKWISLESMRLVVRRAGKDALITKDKLRADVTVEFYIKVEATKDQIYTAAKSLGDRTLNSESVKDLIEAKLVGALRSIAATRDLEEVHLNRDDFADSVQEALRADLAQNGLHLEAVSIVMLDQTDKEALDPNNVFDAVGLRKIVDITKRTEQERNLINRDAEVAIKQQDVDAVKKKLEFDQDQQLATAEQRKQVETYQAEREAETQKFKIEQEQSVREREIGMEQAIKEADISKDLRVQQADLAKDTELVEKEKELEQARIDKERDIEVTSQEREIMIIKKVKEKEEQEAIKLGTVAEREHATQQVITVEKTEEARRQKEVKVIQQEAVSRQDYIEKQISADALAYEMTKKAQAEQTASEKQADAIERLAIANLKEAEAKAEGERKLIEAKNQLKTELILGSGGGVEGGASNKVVQAFLQAGAAMPMFKEMLKFAGIDAEKHSFGEIVRKLSDHFPMLAKLKGKIPDDLKVGTAIPVAKPTDEEKA